MVVRSNTHIIDTLAVRHIYTSMDENWLIRGHEERDYGIDLTIEIFDGQTPTGKVALLQVKGTKKNFDEDVNFLFPTKTIKYALLFQQPFFVLYTSIPDKKTYYIWLQKYASTKLDFDSPNWKKQEHVTLYFPKENQLEVSKTKINDVMDEYTARNEGLYFLADYEWLKEHWSGYCNGQTDLIKSCKMDWEKVLNYSLFLNFYDRDDLFEIDYTGISSGLDFLSRDNLSRNDRHEIISWVDEIKLQIGKLDLLKSSFLSKTEFDKYCVQNSDTTPY